MNDSIVNFLGFYITSFKAMHGFDTNSSWKLQVPVRVRYCAKC